MLRLNVAMMLVAVAGSALWVEQRHRVVIDAPAAEMPLRSAACPDNDNVPYSEACLEYLNAKPAPRPQVVASMAMPAPCPASDHLPYSPGCIAFMKGATEIGMRWRAIADPAPQ